MDQPTRTATLDAMRTASRELPREVLEALCARIEALPLDASAAQRRATIAAMGSAHARQVALALIDQWVTLGELLSPSAFAWALRAAADMDAWHRNRQRIELVWTGPTPPGSTLRRIDQGLLEVITRASVSLTIVTFAAWEMPVLQAALRDALSRGVALTFVIETLEDSGGRYRGDTRDVMGAEIMDRAEVYVWPLALRPRDGDRTRASLHAKCALADDRLLLVSSANLTDNAMNLNMEMGLLVEGDELSGRVGAHLRGLIAEGVLLVARRDRAPMST